MIVGENCSVVEFDKICKFALRMKIFDMLNIRRD